MKHLLLMFTSLLFVVGCSLSHNGQKLQCNEVKFIETFPKEIELSDGLPLSLDLAGCVDVFAVDTLMICKIYEGEYFWKVYSLNTNRFLGNFLARGHGSNEFVSLPGSEMPMQTDTALFCDFWVSSKRMWYRCNLTKTLEQKQPVWERQRTFKRYDNLNTVMYISDSLFYLIQNNGYVGFSHSLYKNDTICDIAHIGNLNDMVVEEDLNTLSAVRCLNRERMCVAEGMLRLNQINLYALDTEHSKTLCVGTELSNVNEVDLCPKKLQHEYYGNILSYGDYFVALYHDLDALDYWMGRGRCELQFFDWTGCPLLCIKLPMMVTSFFISQNRYLYVFSCMGEEEVLYRYDCEDILLSMT